MGNLEPGSRRQIADLMLFLQELYEAMEGDDIKLEEQWSYEKDEGSRLGPEIGVFIKPKQWAKFPVWAGMSYRRSQEGDRPFKIEWLWGDDWFWDKLKQSFPEADVVEDDNEGYFLSLDLPYDSAATEESIRQAAHSMAQVLLGCFLKP